MITPLPQRLLIALALTGLCMSALGQGPDGDDNKPALNPQVKAVITAPYLTPAEAKALRLKHGVPIPEDLADPASAAHNALDRHAYGDPALKDPAADPLDRAEAALRRGELSDAEQLLGQDASVRATRLKVEIFELAGKTREAIALARSVAERLGKDEYKEPAQIVEAVRCAFILSRLTDTGAPAGADHRGMMSLLAAARQQDQFYWPAYLLEAEILADKDNYAQARDAAMQTISFNPACASALTLAGHLAVNAFDMDSARTLADTLDALVEPADLVANPDAEGKAVAAPEPGSIDAACIRARVALRQDDPEQAARDLAPVLKLYPASPEVLEMFAATAAATYEWASLDAQLEAYGKLFPGSPRAKYRVGQALSDLRQYGPAAKYLQAAAIQAPHWATPLIDMGLLQVQSGQDAKAMEALTAATALDPFNVRAENSLKLLKEVMNYSRAESAHFVIRSRPGLDALLAREMLPVMEANHAAVTGHEAGALQHEPAQKTVIDMMPDHQWFAVRIAGLPKIHTIAASTGPIIAMEAPREGPKHTGLYDWPRVLRHEYTHTVGLSRTGNRMPHWFTEAQAQYLERAPRDWNTVQLLTNAYEANELFDFEAINLAFTRPKKPTDRSQAYAQGQWMYEYMVERFGAQSPLDLMDRYARGVREEHAFNEVFHQTREQFMTDFKVWAGKQLTAWGMIEAEGEPSLTDLTKAETGDKEGELTDEQLAKLRREHPERADLLSMTLSRQIEAKGAATDADLIALLQAYAAKVPMDPLPHRRLAQHALSIGDADTAITHLEWLDAREDHTPIYASQLAGMYAQKGEWDKAAEKAERATRMAPYVPTHRELAATIAVKRKDYPTARRHMEFLAALEPDREQHTRRLEALKRLESESAR